MCHSPRSARSAVNIYRTRFAGQFLTTYIADAEGLLWWLFQPELAKQVCACPRTGPYRLPERRRPPLPLRLRPSVPVLRTDRGLAQPQLRGDDAQQLGVVEHDAGGRTASHVMNQDF